MKTLKTSLFSLLLLTFAFQSQAQEKGTLRAFIDGIYARNLREGGLGIGFDYFLGSRLSVAPSVSHILVGGNGEHVLVSADMRYYFMKGRAQMYVMGGLSRFYETISIKRSRSRRSVNTGLGAVFPLRGRIGFNVQASYSVPIDSFVYQGGLTYNIRR